MGCDHFVEPASKLIELPDGAEKMAIAGLDPETLAASRYPCLNEIVDAVRSLPDFTLEEQVYGGRWSISLMRYEKDRPGWVSESAILESTSYSGQKEAPTEFYFYRSTPELIVRISALLARSCGPLALFSEYDEWIVVQPNTPPDAPWFEEGDWDENDDEADDEE